MGAFFETMNNRERILKRIERDKQRREAKRKAFNSQYDDYCKVFDFENLWESGRKCCNGVRWKASVQRWEAHLLTNAAAIHRELQTMSFQKHSGDFYCFDLYERGHLRHIRSLKISERSAQKDLCDNALVPVLSRSHIYDNGATMKNKGISFTEMRLTKHLRRFVREMGPLNALKNGYVVQYDFHHFFDNADHDVLKKIIRKNFTDERMVFTIEKFIDDFGERGLGLGSQISQVLALTLADKLDHEIKDRMGMKFYGRYMDDGYVLCKSKEEAKEVMRRIREICRELNIEINNKKTRIVKFSRGFRFLRVLYRTTGTGRIVRTTNHAGIKRMRQKLRKFRRRYEAGRMSLESVEMALESWFAHCSRADTYWTRLSMLTRFHLMFPESEAFLRRKTNREETIRKAQEYVHEWKKNNKPKDPFWDRIHMIHDYREYHKKEIENGLLQVSFRRCCS